MLTEIEQPFYFYTLCLNFFVDAVDKKMMQNIAAEVNLSETAFLFGESETSFASEAVSKIINVCRSGSP